MVARSHSQEKPRGSTEEANPRPDERADDTAAPPNMTSNHPNAKLYKHVISQRGQNFYFKFQKAPSDQQVVLKGMFPKGLKALPKTLKAEKKAAKRRTQARKSGPKKASLRAQGEDEERYDQV